MTDPNRPYLHLAIAAVGAHAVVSSLVMTRAAELSGTLMSEGILLRRHLQRLYARRWWLGDDSAPALRRIQ